MEGCSSHELRVLNPAFVEVNGRLPVAAYVQQQVPYALMFWPMLHPLLPVYWRCTQQMWGNTNDQFTRRTTSPVENDWSLLKHLDRPGVARALPAATQSQLPCTVMC